MTGASLGTERKERKKEWKKGRKEGGRKYICICMYACVYIIYICTCKMFVSNFVIKLENAPKSSDERVDLALDWYGQNLHILKSMMSCVP